MRSIRIGSGSQPGDRLDRQDRLVAGDVGQRVAGHDVTDRVQVRDVRSACGRRPGRSRAPCAGPASCSRPMFSVTGRRPMATRISRSRPRSASPPSLATIACRIAGIRPLERWRGRLVDAVWTSIPRLRNRRCSSLLTSASSSGTTRSMNSTRWTSAPRSSYRLAHSTPMAPAPTIVTDPGSASRLSASSESIIRSCPRPGRGGPRGALPVARSRSVALASTSPDSPPAHPDAGRAGQDAVAAQDRDAVLLHEELDALDVLVDHGVAALAEGDG